jgi:hypothetical protein
MNTKQKVIAAAGVVLAAVRAVFPVKYAELPGFLRFNEAKGFPEFMQKVDWGTTGLHIAVIAAACAVLVFIFKDK